MRRSLLLSVSLLLVSLGWGAPVFEISAQMGQRSVETSSMESSVPDSTGGEVSSKATEKSSEGATSSLPIMTISSSSAASSLAPMSLMTMSSMSLQWVQSSSSSTIPWQISSSSFSSAQSSRLSIFSTSSSSRRSSSLSIFSTSSSSSRSSVQLVALSTSGTFLREDFGYSIPVIDPSIIVRIDRLNLTSEAITTHLLLALLVAFILGLCGVVLQRLVHLDEKFMKKFLSMLPFQAVITLLLIWIVHSIVPTAFAQDGQALFGIPTWLIPAYAGLFFLVVGSSNYLFNSILVTEGERVEAKFSKLAPLRNHAWFILLVLLGYGIIGAHINPEFSLLPGEQLGIALVTITGLVFSVCIKDTALLFLAKKWKVSGRFRANIGGFAIAVVCILLTRAFALNPGYIYGLPIALLLSTTLVRQREGLFEFLGILWLLFLAAAMWLIGPSLAAYPVLFDLSNLLFVLLVEDAFFELLPLPYLAGGTIFHWKKWVWLVQFVTVLFFLFATLFNPQGTINSLLETPPTMVALTLLGCYAVGVFVLWGYMVWRRK